MKLCSAFLLSLLAAPVLPAQVKVTCSAATATSGSRVELQAQWLGEGPAPSWTWRVEPAWAGQVHPLAEGRALYLPPPFIVEEEKVRILATASCAPEAPGRARVRLQVDGAMGKIMATEVKEFLGHDVLGPSVSLLAGSTGQRGKRQATGARARFGWLTGAAWDPDGGSWMVADAKHRTILRVHLDGRVVPFAILDVPVKPDQAWAKEMLPFLGIPEQEPDVDRCQLAVRPALPGQPDSWRLAVADARWNRVLELDAAGKVVLKMGDGRRRQKDGPIAEAAFHQPYALAYGPEGALYVAEHLGCAIRRIAEGEVRTLLGGVKDFKVRESKGHSLALAPTSLALDPAGQRLLFTSGHGAYALGADGVVHTLVSAEPDPEGAIPLAFPSAIARVGGRILIGDQEGLRLLHEASGTLVPFHGDFDAGMMDAGQRVEESKAGPGWGLQVVGSGQERRLSLVLPGSAAPSEGSGSSEDPDGDEPMPAAEGAAAVEPPFPPVERPLQLESLTAIATRPDGGCLMVGGDSVGTGGAWVVEVVLPRETMAETLPSAGSKRAAEGEHPDAPAPKRPSPAGAGAGAGAGSGMGLL